MRKKKVTFDDLITKIEDMGWFYLGNNKSDCCYSFRKKTDYSDTIVEIMDFGIDCRTVRTNSQKYEAMSTSLNVREIKVFEEMTKHYYETVHKKGTAQQEFDDYYEWENIGYF